MIASGHLARCIDGGTWERVLFTSKMTRQTRTVSELARLAERPLDDVLLELVDCGFDVESPSDCLKNGRLTSAKVALKLSSGPSRLVSDLSKEAGLSEGQTRQILYEKKVLAKRRLKRVPRPLLKEAKAALGISKPQDHKKAEVPIASQQPKPRKPKRPSKEAWPKVGKKEDLVHLTAADIVAIHDLLVKDFAKSKDPIVPAGVRDEQLLKSAVFRPHTSLGEEDKYPTVSMSAAALLHSIVQDHPFFNGNKRTALVSMLVLLDKNGWVFTLDEDDIYEFVIALASHQLIENMSAEKQPSSDEEVLEVSRWLQNHIRKLRKEEYTLKFRGFRAILNSYGCELELARRVGNRINVRRDDLHSQIAYRNEGADVNRNTIHKVRKELGLDEKSGYDSDIFYNKGPKIPRFINKYRKVLDRLAKV